MSTSTYESPHYSPELVAARYIGFKVDGTLLLYEVDIRGFTIRSAPTSEAEHPAELVAQAMAKRGQAFNNVRLPTQP